MTKIMVPVSQLEEFGAHGLLGENVEAHWVHKTNRPLGFAEKGQREICVSSFSKYGRFYHGNSAVVFQATARKWFLNDVCSDHDKSGLLYPTCVEKSPYDEAWIPGDSAPLVIFTSDKDVAGVKMVGQAPVIFLQDMSWNGIWCALEEWLAATPAATSATSAEPAKPAEPAEPAPSQKEKEEEEEEDALALLPSPSQEDIWGDFWE